jgi:hypothetical protein
LNDLYSAMYGADDDEPTDTPVSPLESRGIMSMPALTAAVRRLSGQYEEMRQENALLKREINRLRKSVRAAAREAKTRETGGQW